MKLFIVFCFATLASKHGEVPIYLKRIKSVFSGALSLCFKSGPILTLKAPNKMAVDDILIFYFYLSKKIRLDFSCESSA